MHDMNSKPTQKRCRFMHGKQHEGCGKHKEHAAGAKEECHCHGKNLPARETPVPE